MSVYSFARNADIILCVRSPLYTASSSLPFLLTVQDLRLLHMWKIISLTSFLLLGAALASASLLPSKTVMWGKTLGKRQVQPSSLPNGCVYTCAQFSQELAGMCAITTSQCESIQAASGTSSDDHGCATWSAACDALATQYEQDCAGSSGNCVTCDTATTDANSLCTLSAQACLNTVGTSAADQAQCYTAKAVCDWELSLLSQVMPCGDADCAAPCYALVAFPSLITMLEASCAAGSTPCSSGYSAAYDSISAVAYSCSRDSGYTDCSSVGIWTRSCSYITGAIQTALSLGVTACQSGLTVGSANYIACATAYSSSSNYIQDYLSSVGC